MEWIKRKPTEKNVKISFSIHKRLLKKHLSLNSFKKANYHAMMCDEIIRTNKKVSKAKKREIYNIAFKK